MTSLLTRPQRTGMTAPGPPRSAVGRLFRASRVVPWVWFIGVVFFVLIPVWALLWKSLELPDGGIGLGNYPAALTQPEILQAIFNSFVVATATTAGCLVIAVPLAVLVSRTDLPARGFFRSVAVLTFAAPGFVAAMGWILLFGPRNGLLNQYVLAPLGLPPFDIFSPNGIIFCLVLFMYPLIFMPAVDALDNMDRRLEEAAESLGASWMETFRRVTLPLIMPGVFSGSLLVFTGAFVIFGPVQLLGGPVGYETIPTAMFNLTMIFPPRIEYAAVLGLPVLVVLGGLLILQRQLYGRRRFTTVTGKASTQQIRRLGKWRVPAFIVALVVVVFSIFLPFGVLLLTSFRKALGLPLTIENMVLADNYIALFNKQGIWVSLWNSLWLALVATLGAILLSLLAGWLLERTISKIRPIVQPTMLLPLAIPGAVLGIAIVIAFSAAPFWLGGTLTIMLVAYLIRVIPESFSYIQAGFKQIGGDTEEASRSLGASWSETMRRVTVPLLRGPIVTVAVLNFVILFRELDISIFLYLGRNPVAPVILFDLATSSQFQLMGAFAVVILVINLGVVLLARKLLNIRI